MSTLDYIILAIVAVWFFLAMRTIIKKKGGCSCGGGSCPGGCSGCSSCGKRSCSEKSCSEKNCLEKERKKKWQ